MLPLLLALQIATTDSVYASPALRELVAGAAARNRRVPDGLQSYRARLESEIALVGARSDGLEGTVSLEQVHNELRWRRTGEAEQRVVGYRAQTLGPQLSVLGFFTQSWVVPVLYGNRIGLFFGRDTTRRAPPTRGRRPTGRATTYAVHPLADDRNRFYRFTGGDTVTTLRVEGHDIPIVRVDVEPRRPPRGAMLLFRGEMDLDATRHHVVRLRGHFVTVRARPSTAARLLGSALQAVAYLELVNAEIEGEYWLPSYQRIEAQAALPITGDARSIFRIVSHFRDYRLNDTTVIVADADTLTPLPHRLTWAPRDSISGFGGWAQPLGAATTAVHGSDFDDVAPDVWRPNGRPRFDLRVQHPSDLVRFNRIEGLYTGIGGRLRFRDLAPGVTLSANIGWAWAEGTSRGRAAAEWRGARWIVSAQGGRTLDITNDFRHVFDSGPGLAPLFGAPDDYDYVDRRAATLAVTRLFGDAHRGTRLRLDGGVARDAIVRPHTSGGLFAIEPGFRPNRGVAPGRYLRGAATLEVHPNITGEMLQTGAGALLRYEVGAGEIGWHRVEGRLLARRIRGNVTTAARLDAGTVFGTDIPPQQLFELGGNQGLPGYGYKEFGGNRAAVARAVVMYTLPILRAPIRIAGPVSLPGLAPALAAGVQSGWATTAGSAGRRAIDLLSGAAEPLPRAPYVSTLPVSRPTDGVRTTVDLSLRFFGGGFGIGIARAVDRRAPWKLVVGVQ